jgi:hypothetical protein
VDEETVLDPLSCPVGDEQADIVASVATLFGRPGGLAGGGRSNSSRSSRDSLARRSYPTAGCAEVLIGGLVR